MPKSFQLLLLLPVLASSALAEDVSVVVSKRFKDEMHVGGIFNQFQKSSGTKKTWLELRPKEGVVLIQSVSLNSGACVFDNVNFPISISSSEKLDIIPHCDVVETEIKTDRGAYQFVFK